MRIPTRKSEIERLQAQTIDYAVTEAKLAAMKRDLARLMAERSPAAEEVARTGQMGDLSENAAYQSAKSHLRGVNDRITRLQDKIANAVIIADDSASGLISLGSTVAITIDGREFVYTIVGSQEANPARGRISRSSPLGMALLGKKAGESFKVKLGEGEREVVILRKT